MLTDARPFEARLSDLGPGDFVKIECTACRHDALIPASGFLMGLRGKAVVSIKWAET